MGSGTEGTSGPAPTTEPTSSSPSGAPPAAGPTTGAPPPSTGPAPSPPRRVWIVPVVIVVIIAVILVSLWTLGFLPGVPKPGSSPSGNSGAAVSYAQARGASDSKVAGSGGGSGWKLIFGVGIDSTASRAESTTNATQSGCTLSAWNGNSPPSSVTVSSYTGTLGNGVSPFWVFVYSNGAGAYIVVGVLGGSARVFGQASGANCFPTTGSAQSFSVPSNVIDSPAAVQAALSSGGSVFLSNHTGVSMTMTLIGGLMAAGITLGAQWAVDLTTCPALGGTGATTGATYSAIVNATSATVLTHNVDYVDSC